MNHLSEGRRGEPVPRHRPDSLDLTLQARTLRYQWFVSAFVRLRARLSAKLGRVGAELAARPRPARLGASR